MLYDTVRRDLSRSPRRFLVTGAAGFIGSNIVETLLGLGQDVVAFDNYKTGYKRNLSFSDPSLSPALTIIDGDTRDLDACMKAANGVDAIIHQAALGSVPRSIENPIASHDHNVNGFLNILWAARENAVPRVVYASSSSVYGDNPDLPKVEDAIGNPLSPYALTKSINEQFARVFARNYGLNTIGLRYFNVFGRRQDPLGAYAAVVPKWINRLLSGQSVEIFGDGETSRDFCYIANVVQANILAATTDSPEAFGKVYNIACGATTSLNELYQSIMRELVARGRLSGPVEPIYRDFRKGDIRHSLADISRAQTLLGYRPTHTMAEGLEECIDWYCDNLETAS
jgi:UDP-N-acetylglucosamine 4-epimerase